MNRRRFLNAAGLAALAPVLGATGCPKPDLKPGEDDGDGDGAGLGDDGFDVQRTLTHTVARAFGLRHDEKVTFDEGWSLYERIVQLKGEPEHKKKLDALQKEAERVVNEAMDHVKAAVDGNPTDLLGHRYVKRLPTKGRYVVFSDHHFTYRGHRTNFFEQSGNLWVYRDALEQYNDAGFTLVENGDVEDLVIFDPAWQPGEVDKRKDMTLEQLKERRLVVRLEQLKRILSDPSNAPLVDTVKKFDADKRLIRIAGNHDYDLQRKEFLAVMNEHYPNLERPSDYLFLEDEGGVVRFAIMHGHQFDTSTNPVSAPRFGETISECLGLYYQGPDRNWLWVADDVHGWAVGDRPFRNILADEVVGLGKSVLTDVEKFITGKETASEALTDVGDSLFEAIFKQDIAWDYFDHPDNPAVAVVDEVLTGDRFFKFRILDEERVRSRLREVFTDKATRPTLIFGHSHEPRLDAFSEEATTTFPHYLNAASAGRFENLLWAVEVVDGVASLVSWSRIPVQTGEVQRRVWSSGDKVATAAKDPSQVPS